MSWLLFYRVASDVVQNACGERQRKKASVGCSSPQKPNNVFAGLLTICKSKGTSQLYAYQLVGGDCCMKAMDLGLVVQ